MSQELDEKQQEEIVRAIEYLLQTDSPKAFLFNLGQLEVLHSQALGALLVIQQLLSKHHKKFGVYNTSEVNLEVFQLAQLDQILPSFSTEEEALAAMN